MRPKIISIVDSACGIFTFLLQYIVGLILFFFYCQISNITRTGLGSIQFRNWNCSSIPIPIPELELELELKLVELKMELELKTLELELELELKTGIEFFGNCYRSNY